MRRRNFIAFRPRPLESAPGDLPDGKIAKVTKMTARGHLPRSRCGYASARAFLHNQDPFRTQAALKSGSAATCPSYRSHAIVRGVPESCMLDLGRREFIALVGSTAVWPLAVRAQQLRPVIGFLIPTSSDMQSNRLRALREG